MIIHLCALILILPCFWLVVSKNEYRYTPCKADCEKEKDLSVSVNFHPDSLDSDSQAFAQEFEVYLKRVCPLAQAAFLEIPNNAFTTSILRSLEDQVYVKSINVGVKTLMSASKPSKLTGGIGLEQEKEIKYEQVYSKLRRDRRSVDFMNPMDQNTVDGTGVYVFVVDSGINDHSLEFTKNQIDRSLGSVIHPSRTDTFDCQGHGTGVASVISGRYSGIATGATLVPFVVLDCNGIGSSTYVEQALAEIVSLVQETLTGSKFVINISQDPIDKVDVSIGLRDLEHQIYSLGGTISRSLGNFVDDACNFPILRSLPSLSVATKSGLSLSGSLFSEHGNCLDILVPSRQMNVASNTNGFITADGTSYASAAVAGSLATISQETDLEGHQLQTLFLLLSSNERKAGFTQKYFDDVIFQKNQVQNIGIFDWLDVPAGRVFNLTSCSRVNILTATFFECFRGVSNYIQGGISGNAFMYDMTSNQCEIYLCHESKYKLKDSANLSFKLYLKQNMRYDYQELCTTVGPDECLAKKNDTECCVLDGECDPQRIHCDELTHCCHDFRSQCDVQDQVTCDTYETFDCCTEIGPNSCFPPESACRDPYYCCVDHSGRCDIDSQSTCHQITQKDCCLKDTPDACFPHYLPCNNHTHCCEDFSDKCDSARLAGCYTYLNETDCCSVTNDNACWPNDYNDCESYNHCCVNYDSTCLEAGKADACHDINNDKPCCIHDGGCDPWLPFCGNLTQCCNDHGSFCHQASLIPSSCHTQNTEPCCDESNDNACFFPIGLTLCDDPYHCCVDHSSTCDIARQSKCHQITEKECCAKDTPDACFPYLTPCNNQTYCCEDFSDKCGSASLAGCYTYLNETDCCNVTDANACWPNDFNDCEIYDHCCVNYDSTCLEANQSSTCHEINNDKQCCIHDGGCDPWLPHCGNLTECCIDHGDFCNNATLIPSSCHKYNSEPCCDESDDNACFFPIGLTLCNDPYHCCVDHNSTCDIAGESECHRTTQKECCTEDTPNACFPYLTPCNNQTYCCEDFSDKCDSALLAGCYTYLNETDCCNVTDANACWPTDYNDCVIYDHCCVNYDSTCLEANQSSTCHEINNDKPCCIHEGGCDPWLPHCGNLTECCIDHGDFCDKATLIPSNCHIHNSEPCCDESDDNACFFPIGLTLCNDPYHCCVDHNSTCDIARESDCHRTTQKECCTEDTPNACFPYLTPCNNQTYCCEDFSDKCDSALLAGCYTYLNETNCCNVTDANACWPTDYNDCVIYDHCCVNYDSTCLEANQSSACHEINEDKPCCIHDGGCDPWLPHCGNLTECCVDHGGFCNTATLFPSTCDTHTTEPCCDEINDNSCFFPIGLMPCNEPGHCCVDYSTKCDIAKQVACHTFLNETDCCNKTTSNACYPIDHPDCNVYDNCCVNYDSTCAVADQVRDCFERDDDKDCCIHENGCDPPLPWCGDRSVCCVDHEETCSTASRIKAACDTHNDEPCCDSSVSHSCFFPVGQALCSNQVHCCVSHPGQCDLNAQSSCFKHNTEPCCTKDTANACVDPVLTPCNDDEYCCKDHSSTCASANLAGCKDNKANVDCCAETHAWACVIDDHPDCVDFDHCCIDYRRTCETADNRATCSLAPQTFVDTDCCEHAGACRPNYSTCSSNAHCCVVTGGWTDWTFTTDCSNDCGDGTRTRERTCTNPSPQNSGPCPGLDSEVVSCNSGCCYQTWTSWSDCSVTCGYGTQTRREICQPGTGSGSDIVDSRQCNDICCYVGWTNWGSCSKTCLAGTQTRTNTCVGGTGTDPVLTENQNCDDGCCEWGAWSACSSTCGGGQSSRQRLCSSGTETEVENCNIWCCPYDWTDCSQSCGGGTRSGTRMCDFNLETINESCNTDCCDWSDFGTCTKTCAGGTQVRQRLCSGGIESDPQSCNTDCCPYEPWGDCSKTCATGSKSARRLCTSGWDYKYEDCNTMCCDWGAYDDCSKSCGGGVQTKTRICTAGTESEPRDCNTGCCDWSDWGGCSKSCASGTRSSSRMCNFISEPRSETCNTQCCDWVGWTGCTETCATGTQQNQRLCASGMSYDDQDCNTEACGWGSWSTCNVGCGWGQRTQSRLTVRPNTYESQSEPCYAGSCHTCESSGQAHCYDYQNRECDIDSSGSEGCQNIGYCCISNGCMTCHVKFDGAVTGTWRDVRCAEYGGSCEDLGKCGTSDDSCSVSCGKKSSCSNYGT